MSLNNSPHQSGLTKISLSSKDVPSRADEDEASPLAGKKYQDINQNHGEPSESGRSKRIPGILVGWGKEVLAAFGAVLALAALIAFLGVYNGRQRPQWPYAITINTVLSIFGIILKSCMLVPIAEGLGQLKWTRYQKSRPLADIEVFDSASRGLLGSLHLLFVLRCWHLASLAALITVVAFAVDPFLQQTISYYQTLRPDASMIATLPITHQYSGKSFNQTSDIDESLIGAIYDSLLNPSGEQSTINPNCPSGNCAFQTMFGSLAMCSRCTNITPFLMGNLTTTGWWSGQAIGSHNEVYDFMGLNITLPVSAADGPKLVLSQSPLGNLTVMNITAEILPTQQFNKSLYDIPFSKGDKILPNVTIDSASMPFLAVWAMALTRDDRCTTDWMTDGTKRSNTDCLDPTKVDPTVDPNGLTAAWNGSYADANNPLGYETVAGIASIPVKNWPKVTATLCTISTCGETYNANVTSGALNETVVSQDPVLWVMNDTMAPTEADSGASVTNTYIPSKCVINGTSHNISEYADVAGVLRNDSFDSGIGGIHYTRRDDSLQHEHHFAKRLAGAIYYRNYTLVEATSLNVSLLHQCAYSMSPLFSLDSSTAFTIAELFDGAGRISSVPSIPTQVAPDLNPWSNFSQTDWGSSQHLISLFNGGNCSTSSMEDAFRSIARTLTDHLRTNGNMDVQGIGYTYQTYVRAQMLWLILPGALVVISCLFLIATITQSRNAMGERVWKSSQVALMLHGLDNRDRYGAMESPEVMERFSKSTDVRLGLKHAGWRLLKDVKGT